MRRIPFALVGALLATLAACVHFGGTAQQQKLIATIQAKEIDEMSGIVKSARYPGVYWVHNDSGDEARIFAIDSNGKVVGRAEGIEILGADNVDWEDIAIAGDTLFVADTGNNGNARRDLSVYVLKEPNPRETTKTRRLRWLPLAYPDQKAFPPEGARNFDCEAVFSLRGKLYFVTKHRANALLPATSANLYRLDTEKLGQTNVLTKLDTARDLGGWVTAADVSPDGKTLAVLTQAPVAGVWFFRTDTKDDRFLSAGKGRQIVLKDARQCEAICFTTNRSLLVTNEQGDIFQVTVP